MADTYSVERSTTIDAPAQRVYDLVADFHCWTAWSPWEDLDPELRRSYSGSPAGEGAVYHWLGNRKAGTGRMEITQATQPTRVLIDLRFEKPWKAHNETSFVITPDGSGSRVMWSMTGRKTVMTRVLGIVRSMDALMGPDFEKGLGRLKATAEGSSAR